MRTIEEILAAMQELIGPGDTETQHAMADDLLCEAIKQLCWDNGYLDLGDDLVKAYESVDKRYA